MSVRVLQRLLHEVAELKLRLANLVEVGTVYDRDPIKGYRILRSDETDAEGNPDLSPWLPHPDSGGANADWRPLSKGQIVAAINPAGDPKQGFLVRAGFGGANSAPSQDLDEVVLHNGGGVRIAIKAGALSLVIGGTSWTFSADGLHQAGGAIEHDGTTIDKTHVHSGVVHGDDPSGPPV